LHGFEGVGEGKKVMGVSPVDAAPAEVVGKPRRLGSASELLDAPEVFAAEGLRGTEVHRDAMLDHLILIEDLIQNFERLAAVNHVIFRDDLEPVDDWLLRKDVVIMGDAQTDAYSIVCESVESIGWHGALLTMMGTTCGDLNYLSSLRIHA
jgi:hypothetical protein